MVGGVERSEGAAAEFQRAVADAGTGADHHRAAVNEDVQGEGVGTSVIEREGAGAGFGQR